MMLPVAVSIFFLRKFLERSDIVRRFAEITQSFPGITLRRLSRGHGGTGGLLAQHARVPQ